MKIEQLAELSKIIDKYRPEQIQLIHRMSTNRTNQLYEKLLSNPEIEEKEAARHIYGEESTSAFRKLKTRLTDKLLNTLFFIDLRGPKHSSLLKSSMHCYRQMAIYFILIRFGQTDLALVIAEKLILKAEKNDLTEVLYPVLSSLSMLYVTNKLDYKKFKLAKVRLEKHYEILKKKHLIDDLLSTLYASYGQSRASANVEITNKVEPFLDEVDKIQSQTDSYLIQARGFSIKILYAQIKGNASLALEYCADAIFYFKNSPLYKDSPSIQLYYIQKLAIYSRIKDYESGVSTHLEGSELCSKYSYNWHAIKYYYFLLCTQTNHFNEAYRSYQDVISDPNFKNISPFLKEVWSIFEAYIYILLRELETTIKIQFSANKYVNNIPTYSGDKKGSNVSILIAHFILLCYQKNFSQAIDRVDALKQYAHRHLKSNDSKRSNLFIKMLISVAKADFNPIRSERYAERYIKALKETPSSISEQSNEIEIIPYEDLWEILMKELGKVN